PDSSLYTFARACSTTTRDLHSFPTRRSSDLIFPGSFRAVSTRKTYPSGFLGSKSQIPHPVGLPTDTNRFLGRDGEDIGLHRFVRSEEHTSELQSRENLVCRLLLEKKNKSAGV